MWGKSSFRRVVYRRVSKYMYPNRGRLKIQQMSLKIIFFMHYFYYYHLSKDKLYKKNLTVFERLYNCQSIKTQFVNFFSKALRL